jgi:uroporphyrinogen-III decarboxylase
MTPDSSSASFASDYLAREKRVNDAFALKKSDRVPVVPLIIHFYPNRITGISNKEAMYDLAKAHAARKEVTVRHNWDGTTAGELFPGKILELLGDKQLAWPGGTLADHLPFQFVEGEYMKPNEYDEMLSDPNAFALTKLLPQVSTTLAPLLGLAQTLKMIPLITQINGQGLPFLTGMLCGQPPVLDALEKLVAIGKEFGKIMHANRSYTQEMAQLGFPLLWSAVTYCAYDMVSDYLRGMKGSMLDMYRAPDKLLKAVETIIPLTIQSSIAQAQMSGNKRVFIPLHRGAGGFMNDKQFEKFYWPGLKALLLGLVNAGLTPIPFFEGNYTPRVKFLKELPPGKVVGKFDIMDRKLFKKELADVMCFWGNVPSSMLCTGTPEQVKTDVKELIDLFKETGGLIIDATNGLPDEARPENVQAMTDAVMEYGTYN